MDNNSTNNAAQDTTLYFDFGQISYKSEQYHHQGKLKFGFLHELVNIDLSLLQRVDSALRDWISSKDWSASEFEGGLQAMLAIVRLCAVSTLHLNPQRYQVEGEVGCQKLLTQNLHCFAEWFFDNAQDEPELRADPCFPDFMYFYAITVYQILTFQYSSVEQLLSTIRNLHLVEKHPVLLRSFHIWYFVAHHFKFHCKYNKDQIQHFANSVRTQYEHELWLGIPLNRSRSVDVALITRYHTCAGDTNFELHSLLNVIIVTEEIRRDQHIKRFKFIVLLVYSIINDLFSLKKEISSGVNDNLVCVFRDKGHSLSESVNMTCKLHDEYMDESKNIYQYLCSKYTSDSDAMKYIELIRTCFIGCFQFHSEYGSMRYGKVDWKLT